MSVISSTWKTSLGISYKRYQFQMSVISSTWKTHEERLERMRMGGTLTVGQKVRHVAHVTKRFVKRHPVATTAVATVLTGGLAGAALPLLPAMGITYGATKVGGKVIRTGKQLRENRTISRTAVQAKNLASEAFKKTTVGQIHQAKQEGWRNQHFGSQSEFSDWLRGSESKDAKEAAQRKQEEEQHKEQSNNDSKHD